MSKSHINYFLIKQAEKSETECRRLELALLENNPHAQIIDLGCAEGAFTLKIAEAAKTKNICAVEIEYLNIGKARGLGIDARQGDLNQRLPFDDKSFDIAVASHVIEHLNDTDTFLREVSRVLKPNGYLIIATPNLAAWHHIIYLLLGKQPTIAEVSDYALVGTYSPRGNNVDRIGPAHRRIFTIGALNSLLEYYGFRIEKSLGTGYFPISGLSGRIMSRIDKWHATNIVIKARIN
jgi:SAM-dependent methyltransferase